MVARTSVGAARASPRVVARARSRFGERERVEARASSSGSENVFQIWSASFK